MATSFMAKFNYLGSCNIAIPIQKYSMTTFYLIEATYSRPTCTSCANLMKIDLTPEIMRVTKIPFYLLT